MSRDSKIACVALGIIGFVITCWALFWGTIVVVAHHFIQKYW